LFQRELSDLRLDRLKFAHANDFNTCNSRVKTRSVMLTLVLGFNLAGSSSTICSPSKWPLSVLTLESHPAVPGTSGGFRHLLPPRPGLPAAGGSRAGPDEVRKRAGGIRDRAARHNGGAGVRSNSFRLPRRREIVATLAAMDALENCSGRLADWEGLPVIPLLTRWDRGDVDRIIEDFRVSYPANSGRAEKAITRPIRT
jgi:hypothetical protein